MSINAAQTAKKGQARVWLQKGGTAPGNLPTFYGLDAQYLAVNSLTRPVRGGVTPQYVADPYRRGAYVLTGIGEEPPDLPEAALMVRERVGTLPFTMGDLLCPQTLYLPRGASRFPGDLNRGWTDVVEIYGDGRVIDVDGGERSAFESDEPIEDTVNYKFARYYGIAGLLLTRRADTAITTLVKDIAYAPGIVCGDCGSPNDGSRWIYAVADGPVGADPYVLYSADGGQTWASANITPAASAEAPVAIRVLPSGYLLVASPAGTGTYYWSELNPETGVPGAFTAVTTGFTATPADMYFITDREVFFCGASGTVFKLTQTGAGVSLVATLGAATLNRIDGDGRECLVIGGASGAVYYSLDRGRSWATAAATPSANNIVALAVITDRTWFVGDASGGVFYTRNRGASWTQVTLPGTAPSVINDIRFPTPEIGWIAATTGGVAALYSTLDGGNSWLAWGNGSPRLLNTEAFLLARRLAHPRLGDVSILANTLACAGTATGGTDGVLLSGQVNVL